MRLSKRHRPAASRSLPPHPPRGAGAQRPIHENEAPQDQRLESGASWRREARERAGVNPSRVMLELEELRRS
ncbi:unnamed protein product [Pleuronectes platessa]|uniref:Uncharacterized protein n=1 Tax=Pleuronectes platessa TaxID=8262 RepID=A0A9N7YYW9_PLEPL|nr:unnamed protein product [Pleuronectes platessa]